MTLTNQTFSYATLTISRYNTDGEAITTIVGVLDDNGVTLTPTPTGAYTVTGTMIPKGSLQ